MECFHMTDVASAILVSQNNETVAMLVSQTSAVVVWNDSCLFPPS